MKKNRFVWLKRALVVAVSVAGVTIAGCGGVTKGGDSNSGGSGGAGSGGDQGGGTNSTEDNVDLSMYADSAGSPDIRHGTEAYGAPTSIPRNVHDRIFVAFLNGGQETPPVESAALGAMVLILNRGGTRLDYLITHNVQNPVAAHIHTANPGEAGAIAIPLLSPLPNTGGTLPVSAAQAQELLAGRLYVNVHSAANAAGEIRGQILRPGETLFSAPLRGAEENPPVQTTATGFASVVLNAARDQIRYHVTTTGITPTAAHIHRGIAGVNGAIAYPLMPLQATIDGTQTITDADLKDFSLRQFYVNVHSAENPKGEMRGQLLRPGETVFAANLTGGQEVPPSGSLHTGNGMVVLGMAGAQFLYVLNTDATPTLAHIHKAPGGVNGAVEVPFSPVSPAMSGFADLGPDRAADVKRGLWYLNVHTADHPMGDVRGQLLRPGETLYTAVLGGANEVPPVTSMAGGGVGMILNAARTELRYDGTLTGLVPTLAHIHAAPVGMNGPVLYPLALMGLTLTGTQPVTADDLTKLDAAGLYVNAHSAANPMGEERGQLNKQ